MRKLEDFLRPTQKSLFKMLSIKFSDTKEIASKDSFLLIEGEVPIMLLAHLDTVHKEPVRYICKSKDGNILMSPQGIGGDDRCGVYALIRAYEFSVKKPWLLFLCDEEIGGIGAKAFCKAYVEKKLPAGVDDLKMLIEIDRKGKNDAVYYDCANADFEEYISSKGFKTAYGSFSDISVIAPELGVAAVNLSSGYHNAHQLCEYINRKEIDATIQKVVGIVSDVSREYFPKYKYIEKSYCNMAHISWWADRFDDYLDDPEIDADKKLKSDLKKLSTQDKYMYSELLDIYTMEELEEYRKKCGDKIIRELYEYEICGVYYDFK